MIPFLIGLLTCFGAFFRSRYNLALEILALREELGVLKRKHPRARLRIQDRIFSTLPRRVWPAGSHVLVIVKPETVVAWVLASFAHHYKTAEPFLPVAPRGLPSIPRSAQQTSWVRLAACFVSECTVMLFWRRTRPIPHCVEEAWSQKNPVALLLASYCRSGGSAVTRDWAG
jgi:hypothetical protein